MPDILNDITIYPTCIHPEFQIIKNHVHSVRYVKIYDKRNCLIERDLPDLQEFKALEYLEIDQTESKQFDFLNVMRNNSEIKIIMYKVTGIIRTMVTNKCHSIEICSLITPAKFECNSHFKNSI